VIDPSAPEETIVIVAASLATNPSLAKKDKLSIPENPAWGVYTNCPVFALKLLTLPADGSATNP
jgi:hypothetical protein